MSNFYEQFNNDKNVLNICNSGNSIITIIRSVNNSKVDSQCLMKQQTYRKKNHLTLRFTYSVIFS